MRQLVVASRRCLWGDARARENGWTPEENWWYFTRPADPGPDLKEELGI